MVFLLISSLMPGLLKSVLFSFEIFGDFSCIILLLIFNLMFSYISFLFNLLVRFMIQNMDYLVKCSVCFSKECVFICDCVEFSCKCQLGQVVYIKFSVSLLIYCLFSQLLWGMDVYLFLPSFYQFFFPCVWKVYWVQNHLGFWYLFDEQTTLFC